MQEIMYYLLFSSYENHFLVQIYVDLFIPKRKSGQVFHACVLGMLIRLIGGQAVPEQIKWDTGER